LRSRSKNAASSAIVLISYVDGDVVLGADPPRLDRQSDDPQRHAMNSLGERQDEDQAWSARVRRDFPGLKTTARSYCLMTWKAITTSAF